MNKIVREHYPVSKLPADLVGDSRLGLHARVTIEVEPSPARRRWTIDELKALRDKNPVAQDDPVERIRKLRDEWD